MNVVEAISSFLVGLILSVSQVGLLSHGLVTDLIPPPQSTSASVTVSFVGDILLARDIEAQYRASSTYDVLQYVRQTPLLKADYQYGNFEAAIPKEHIPTPAFNTRFSVNPTILKRAELSFSHLSLANNHAYDFGSVGYLNTINSLKAAGFAVTGHPTSITPSSVTYIGSTTTIGVLAINAFNVALDEAVLADYVADMVAKSDLQIAYVHGGEEYQISPTTYQAKLARSLIDQGVDIYIGHHPHVVQSIEWYADRPIFYSLGNFVFDQYFSIEVQNGLGLVVKFDDTEEVSISLYPHSSETRKGQPQLLSDKGRQSALQTIADNSDLSLKTAINKGEITFSLASK